jgi:hypothetical protein
MASGLVMVVMVVELRSRGNERGGHRGGLSVVGCSGAFYTAEGRSRGGRPMKGRRRRSGAPLWAILGGDRPGGGE